MFWKLILGLFPDHRCRDVMDPTRRPGSGPRILSCPHRHAASIWSQNHQHHSLHPQYNMLAVWAYQHDSLAYFIFLVMFGSYTLTGEIHKLSNKNQLAVRFYMSAPARRPSSAAARDTNHLDKRIIAKKLR